MVNRKAKSALSSTVQSDSLHVIDSNTTRSQRSSRHAVTKRSTASHASITSKPSLVSLPSINKSGTYGSEKIIRITSWNTQGDALSTIFENMESILPRDRDNILLVQEAGSLNGNTVEKFGRVNYRCHFAQHETAKNKRCTTGILVCENYCHNANLYHINLTEVRRPLVLCQIFLKHFSLYILTVHATADSSVSKGEIEAIVKYLKCHIKEHGNFNDQWLLMGDFNLPPEQLQTSTVISKESALCSGLPTHQSGRQLDYAIVSEGLVRNIKSLNANTGVRRCNMLFNSDHFSIYCEIDPNMPLI